MVFIRVFTSENERTLDIFGFYCIREILRNVTSIMMVLRNETTKLPPILIPLSTFKHVNYNLVLIYMFNFIQRFTQLILLSIQHIQESLVFRNMLKNINTQCLTSVSHRKDSVITV